MQNTEENILELQEVIRRETPRLLRIPGVKNIAVALKYRNDRPTDTLCIRVSIKELKIETTASATNGNGQQTEQSQEELARKKEIEIQKIKSEVRLQGYPIDVVEVGFNGANVNIGCQNTSLVVSDLIPQCPGDPKHKKKYETLQGGINIGQEKIENFGTLGMIVFKDNYYGHTESFILSCAHVIGTQASNNDNKIYITQGDEVKSEYRVAETVQSLHKIKIDASIAKVIDNKRGISDGIFDVNEFEKFPQHPTPGMDVVFSGAFSGKREGAKVETISENTFTIRKKRIINGQLSIEDEIIACAGDSGSIVFGKEKNGKLYPIGLLKSAFNWPTNVPTQHWGTAIKFNKLGDLGFRLHEESNIIYKIWNMIYRKYFYSSQERLKSSDIRNSSEFKEQAFIGTNPNDVNSTPLYSWFNPTTKNHLYSIEKTIPKLTSNEPIPDYIYNGKLCHVSLKCNSSLTELSLNINNNDNVILKSKANTESLEHLTVLKAEKKIFVHKNKDALSLESKKPILNKNLINLIKCSNSRGPSAAFFAHGDWKRDDISATAPTNILKNVKTRWRRWDKGYQGGFWGASDPTAPFCNKAGYVYFNFLSLGYGGSLFLEFIPPLFCAENMNIFTYGDLEPSEKFEITFGNKIQTFTDPNILISEFPSDLYDLFLSTNSKVIGDESVTLLNPSAKINGNQLIQKKVSSRGKTFRFVQVRDRYYDDKKNYGRDAVKFPGFDITRASGLGSPHVHLLLDISGSMGDNEKGEFYRTSPEKHKLDPMPENRLYYKCFNSFEKNMVINTKSNMRFTLSYFHGSSSFETFSGHVKNWQNSAEIKKLKNDMKSNVYRHNTPLKTAFENSFLRAAEAPCSFLFILTDGIGSLHEKFTDTNLILTTHPPVVFIILVATEKDWNNRIADKQLFEKQLKKLSTSKMNLKYQVIVSKSSDLENLFNQFANLILKNY